MTELSAAERTAKAAELWQTAPQEAEGFCRVNIADTMESRLKDASKLLASFPKPKTERAEITCQEMLAQVDFIRAVRRAGGLATTSPLPFASTQSAEEEAERHFKQNSKDFRILARQDETQVLETTVDEALALLQAAYGSASSANDILLAERIVRVGLRNLELVRACKEKDASAKALL